MKGWLRLGVLLVLLGALACGSKGGAEEAGASPSPEPLLPDLKVANASNPGQPLDLASHLVKGKQTLFEFYSDQCPPCREMEKVVELIASKRGDLAIRRVDIDRRGHDGIDFDSPLAEQHGIEKVPCFRLYSADGKLEADGDRAKDLVRQWYYEAQMPDDPAMERIKERYRKDGGES